MSKPFILVVDDNKITTKLIKRYLETNGFEADIAYNGVECLEMVEQRKPDAIILDVMMPKMDGYETAKNLKGDSNKSDIPVVIVTALNDVANQLKSIEAGADDFLSKPIEEKLLIAKVKLLSNYNLANKKISTLKEAINSSGSKSADEILNEAGLD